MCLSWRIQNYYSGGRSVYQYPIFGRTSCVTVYGTSSVRCYYWQCFRYKTFSHTKSYHFITGQRSQNSTMEKKNTLPHLRFREKLWMNAIYPQTVRAAQEKYPKTQIFNKNSDSSVISDFSYFFRKSYVSWMWAFKIENFSHHLNIMLSDFLRVKNVFIFLTNRTLNTKGLYLF